VAFESDRHRGRQEIARYLLSRGPDAASLTPSTAVLDLAARTGPILAVAPAGPAGQAAVGAPALAFPPGLEPVRLPTAAERDPASPLPPADVVVITWMVDELAGLARVFTTGHAAATWVRDRHNNDTLFAPRIRAHAPAATPGQLASFQMPA